MLRQMILLGGLGLMIAGCSYYEVTDTGSGRTYYTRMITDRWGGSIAFEDARTGDDVVLRNYQVHKVTHDQYDAGIGARITAVVTPAAAVLPPSEPGSTVVMEGDSRVVISTDGTRTVISPDGTRTVFERDGTRTVIERDGTRTVIAADGSRTVLWPNGTRTVIAADGTRTLISPDGTRTVISPDRSGAIAAPGSDSTVITPRPGGSVEVHTSP